MDLLSDRKTGAEIRKLLQEFLNARCAAITPQKRPVIQPRLADSQDSQDEYGLSKFDDLDMDDPDLIAAIGGDAQGTGCAHGRHGMESRLAVVCPVQVP